MDQEESLQLIHAAAQGGEIVSPNFRDLNLEGQTLKNLKVKGGTFQGSFQGTKFSRCFFEEVNCSGADFTEAELSGGHYAQVNLTQAILQNTTVTDVEFLNLLLDGVQISRTIFLRSWFGGGISGKNISLQNSFFLESTLDKLFLEDSSLDATIFRQSQIGNVKLINTSAQGIHLTMMRFLAFSGRSCNLERANFQDSYLEGADFSGAFLKGAFFANTHLQKAVFAKAQAPQAIFSGANLSYADLRELNATASDFSHATLQEANLNGADFSLADLHRATLPHIHGANVASARQTNPNRARAEDFVPFVRVK
ncbi:MAG: pentapeptide repeat-containing protein [Deltaproteobacteria bacterium]|jgi:uncharacterized protein YjbI with pentapeptide repeats|nr:pentapeptide repeat-containing protein [Deltaproteobacteria bacterium]